MASPVRRAGVRLDEKHPGVVGAREFIVDLEPETGFAWRDAWVRSTASVTVDGRSIPITMYDDRTLTFACPDNILEQVVEAVDALIANVNDEVERKEAERQAGEPERQRAAEDAQKHLDDLRTRLERLPPPAD